MKIDLYYKQFKQSKLWFGCDDGDNDIMVTE